MAKRYWGAITNEGAEYLSKCNLSASTYKILFYLFKIDDDDNLIKKSKRNILKNMQEQGVAISRANFYSKFAQLIEHKIIFPVEDDYYFINPEIYYQGGLKNGRILTARFLTEILKISDEDLDEKTAYEIRHMINKKYPNLPIIDEMLNWY